jgi:hypothetical protein
VYICSIIVSIIVIHVTLLTARLGAGVLLCSSLHIYGLVLTCITIIDTIILHIHTNDAYIIIHLSYSDAYTPFRCLSGA